MSRQGVLGLSIALIEGPGVIWSSGFGFTDQSRSEPVNAGTVFSVQSISKTYTTTAFLRMVDRRLFRLDDSVRKYVPEFTIRSRVGSREQDRITFRHLLSHRAGLPHEAPRGGNFDNCECSFDDHIRSIFGTWLKAPVGARYSYSNLGIDLVGYAMERRIQRPFDQVMRDWLLQPLGMRHSTFNHDEALRSGSFARGQIGGKDVPRFLLAIVPSGGMYSTVGDMARFVSLHLARGKIAERRLISSQSLDEMYRIQAPTDHQLNGYGLGIEQRYLWGTIVRAHGGGGFGFQAEQRWIPAQQIGVVVLTNYGDDESVAVPLANRALELMLRVKLGAIPKSPPVVLTDNPAEDADSAALAHLVGTYRGYSSIRTLRHSGGQLELGSGNTSRPLVAHGPAEFTADDERFRCELDNAGRPIRINYLGPNGTDVLFPNDQPDQPAGPNKPEWSKYVATYVGKANGEEFTSDIFLKNGYLYSTRGGGTRLMEYAPDLFFTADGESVIFTDKGMLLGNRPLVRQPPK